MIISLVYKLANSKFLFFPFKDATSLLLNDKLLDELSSEEQVITLAVNQLLKHPENKASRLDTSDVSAFLAVEKLQVGGLMYPYFSALSGPAAECPEVRMYILSHINISICI